MSEILLHVNHHFTAVYQTSLCMSLWHFYSLCPFYDVRCYVSTAVMNGALYALGGYDGHNRLNTTERYQPRNNQWSLAQPMIQQRSDASATSLGGTWRPVQFLRLCTALVSCLMLLSVYKSSWCGLNALGVLQQWISFLILIVVYFG